MGQYMIQAAYGPLAMAAFTRSPQDRTIAIRDLIERAGGTVECIYFCLGEYDVVVIYEAPDDTVAAAITLASTAPGHLRLFSTTKLLTPDEIIDAQRLANTLSHAAPSGD